MALLGAESAFGLEAYEIDRWLSYDFHGLRIRPQLDLNIVYNDNVFFAPGPSRDVFLRTAAFVVPIGGRYLVIQNGVPSPVAYTGLVQFQVFPDFAGAAQGRSTDRSPVFPTSQPPQVVPVSPGQVAEFAALAPVDIFAPRQGDFIWTVSPGMKLQLGDEGANYVNVEYNNDYTRYVDTGITPSAMHRMTAAIRYERSRLRFEANQSAAFLSTFLGGGINRGQRLIERWTASTDAKLTWDSSAKTDIYASGQFNLTDYSGNVGIYNNNAWRGNLGASYKRSERVFFFAEGHYGQQSLRAPVANLPGSPYSQIYGGYVGIRGQFTSKIEGSIRGGYEIRDFPNVAVDGTFAIPAAEVSVTYTPRDTTLVSLSYSRRTDVAAQIAQQAVAFDSLRLGVRQLMGRGQNWLASADISYSNGSFDSLKSDGRAFDRVGDQPYRVLVIRQVDYKRDETAIHFSFGMRYSPRKWLSMGLNYDYDIYDNQFADAGLQDFFLAGYDAHRVMFGIQIGY